MSTIILRLSILSVGIFLAAYLVPGIHAAGYGPIIEAAILLGLFNLIIKPILFILTLPINILSLGLFTFLINGFLLWFVSVFISGLEVAGFGVSILGALVISIFSIIVNRLVR
ncbi:MAG: phage holin family protein [Thermodesulfobacteriota bacterium]|nr:MAG: phage holin family protein [Thermodesulfobacteriota bacterium]